MKVVGLITEYNPFHNGHKYHIEEAKRATGAEFCIAVMSGNFVQRGIPAIIDKYSRTKMALSNGVDLVLELPVCYATGSAEYFAHEAVSLLNKLGIVNTLCFGSECGDISLLQTAAHYLSNMPDCFDDRIKCLLKEGLTYPAARSKALKDSMLDRDLSLAHDLSTLLSEPNNILGIEYMKALQHFSSDIHPITIQRIAAHYHDEYLASNSANQTIPGEPSVTGFETVSPAISSATALRNSISSQNDRNTITNTALSVPKDVAAFLLENYQKTYPVTEDDFAQIIKYKLSMESSEILADYMDISPDLADRMKNLPDYDQSISCLAQKIKARNITLTRVNRALTHLLLNIKTDHLKNYMTKGYTPYARVLGIRKDSSFLLRHIEKSGQIPIITKVSKAPRQLDEVGMQMLSSDILATHIYNQAVYHKYGTSLPNEYKHGIIIL